MTKAHYDTFSVLDTAMQIIQDEHRHFMEEGLENEEYVARVVRIAESVATLLQSPYRTKREIETNILRIIHYGRQLFVDGWMRTLPSDGEPPDEEDAIREYNKDVKKHRTRGNKRSSKG